MKSIISGIIIFGIIVSIGGAFVSCSCNRNKGEVEMDDSTKIALAMERKRMEEPEFEIVTTHGTMKLRLYSQTPKHRDNFVKLVAEKYYDGLRFHRVINGFMIQGGDPFSRDTARIASWGMGGPDYTIPAEFVPEYRHKKGAIAAARKGDLANPKKASSGSQFYIVQDEFGCSHLDGDYTVYGEVYEGLEVIDAIAAVPTDYQNRPREDVMILSISRTDLPKEEAQAEPADSVKTE